MKRPWLHLVEATAEASGQSKAVTEQVLRRFFAELAAAVWGRGRISVPGLAVFRVRSRKPRQVANPQTGELMTLPRARAVAVRVAGSWRRRG